MPEQVTASITLSPTSRLKWADDDPAPWQERWFGLGAGRGVDADQATAFWRDIAAACITTLCHVANPDTPSAADADLLPGL